MHRARSIVLRKLSLECVRSSSCAAASSELSDGTTGARTTTTCECNIYVQRVSRHAASDAFALCLGFAFASRCARGVDCENTAKVRCDGETDYSK